MRHEIAVTVTATYTVTVVTEAGVTEEQLIEHADAVVDDRSSRHFSESLTSDGIKNEVEHIEQDLIEDQSVIEVISEEVDADENFEFDS